MPSPFLFLRNRECPVCIHVCMFAFTLGPIEVGREMSRYSYIIVAMFLVTLYKFGCNRTPSAALKQQTNATIHFYGVAVDQNGKPLAGATIEYQVDAYPKD